MKKAQAGLAIIGAALLLTGCNKQTASHTINDSMSQIMEPNAEAIWDTMSAAYNERGDALVSTKLDDAAWLKIEDASALMQERAEEMATAKTFVVAAENVPIMGSQAEGQKTKAGADWDPVGAKTVQARIDAKPDLFREKARALAESAKAMHRAAMTKDAVLLYKTASELDEVCDSCHEPFWGTDEPPPYPTN
jgi:hypothetical protein